MTKLESAIKEAEAVVPTSEFPRALPMGHISPVPKASKIISQGLLSPKYCTVMRKRITYLFYGGVFYRTSQAVTQEEQDYPIGFLFKPTVVTESTVHYPFDTGGMAHGIYNQRLPSYKSQYHVTATGLGYRNQPTLAPRVLVKHLYGSNKRYYSGIPDTRMVNKPSPIPGLLNFLINGTDQSDHRRLCIESHTDKDLELPMSCIWIGYPDIFDELVQKYRREHEEKSGPLKIVSYPAFGRFRPSELCARLDALAYNYLQEFEYV